MKLSIILLNFNKSALTLACIKSLLDQYKKEIEDNYFEIIVVDNASNSTSLLELEKGISEFTKIKLIKNTENFGFGKGNNIGVSNSTGEDILFLNNDTRVLDKGILGMVDILENYSEIGIVGGQLRNEDGSLQPSTGDFYSLYKAILLLLGAQRLGLVDKSPQKISEVDWVKGGLLMIKKNVFQKINGFDENIFMYTEDMELCYRTKKAGFKIFFYPDINVIHKEHGSTNRTFAVVNIYKNLLYFYRKHKSVMEYSILKCVMATKALLLITMGALTGNKYLKQTYQEALSVIK